LGFVQLLGFIAVFIVLNAKLFQNTQEMGKVIKISDEDSEASLSSIDGQTWLKLAKTSSLLYCSFPNLIVFEMQCDVGTSSRGDRHNFWDHFTNLGKKMFDEICCEEIALIGAHAQPSSENNLYWLFLTCGGNLKDVLSGYITACKNIPNYPSELFRLKPVHDALLMRKHLSSDRGVEDKACVLREVAGNAAWEEKRGPGSSVGNSAQTVLTSQLKKAEEIFLTRFRANPFQIMSSEAILSSNGGSEIVLAYSKKKLRNQMSPNLSSKKQRLLTFLNMIAGLNHGMMSTCAVSQKPYTAPKTSKKSQKRQEITYDYEVFCEICNTWVFSEIMYGENDIFLCKECSK